jgi:hypothetical protein
MTAAGHDEPLALLAEVFELEAQTRGERRVDRLRKASRLPPGKTFQTLDGTRVPRVALLRVQNLARGGFLEHGGASARATSRAPSATRSIRRDASLRPARLEAPGFSTRGRGWRS